MSLGRLFLWSFLLALPQAKSVMSHSGGGWVDDPRAHKSEGSGSDSWDSRVVKDFGSPSLTGIAKSAREALTGNACTSSDQPPGNLKCAHQVTRILEAAEVSVTPPTPMLSGFDGSDAVVGVVDELIKTGWKASAGPCPARIPGSVVFTNPEFTSMQRSHIGVVGPNGEIIHNKGEGGDKGCLVSSDPADGSIYSQQSKWYNNVRCLIPPDANVGTI